MNDEALKNTIEKKKLTIGADPEMLCGIKEKQVDLFKKLSILELTTIKMLYG